MNDDIMRISFNDLIDMAVEALGGVESDDRFAVPLPDHVVDHDGLARPPVPLLAVLALEAVVLLFYEYPFPYCIGSKTDSG